MIACIYIPNLPFDQGRGLMINFGGKYLYSWFGNKKIRRRPNINYIPGFFDLTDSKVQIECLSALVGGNGSGKSLILKELHRIFTDDFPYQPGNKLVVVEIDGESKILFGAEDISFVDEEFKNITVQRITSEEKEKLYQTLYYSSHFDLLERIVNKDYNFSQDYYVQSDLEYIRRRKEKGPEDSFDFYEELNHLNTLRIVEMVGSSVFKNRISKVFGLPSFSGIQINFKKFKIEDQWNYPRKFENIIKKISEKIQKERKDWVEIREFDKNHKVTNQVEVNKYLLKRYILEALLSVFVSVAEEKNNYLEEGYLSNMDPYGEYENLSAYELFMQFIENASIKIHKESWKVFDAKMIREFFEEVEELSIELDNKQDVQKSSLRMDVEASKKILKLHKRILNNLVDYYKEAPQPVEISNYRFIAVDPLGREMSSGETSVLNLFSRVYDIISSRLIVEKERVAIKSHYVLIFDEADLGFHPMWKKKYIKTLITALPSFFEELREDIKLQIIIATHDPFTLSDIPSNNVVFLKKTEGELNILDEDGGKIGATFGGNISELLAHSFFLEDGLIGDFAKSKIENVIGWIKRAQELEADEKQTAEFKKKLERNKKIINLIGESVVRFKLAEMIDDLIPQEQFKNEMIEKEIKYLEKLKDKS